MDGSLNGANYNSFAKRFTDLNFLRVHISQPDYYHQRKIKKLELFQRNSILFYSVAFDSNGKILVETRKGTYFYISKQNRTDSIRQRDTLILSYVRDSILMRIDTIVTQHYQYQSKDSLITFSRQQSSIWYLGALINEQNDYFNQHFLNKKIALNQGNGIGYAAVNRSGKKITHRIYLHRRLKTDFDSSRLYPFIQEVNDINFSAYKDSGRKQLNLVELKGHPFVQQWAAKNRKDYMTKGIDFQEPIFMHYYTGCASGVYRAQQTRERTSYGFTSRQDALYDTFYSEYYDGEENYVRGNEGRQRNKTERSTILNFRYSYFE